MNNLTEFQKWLHNAHSFSDRSCRDTVSRLKRANSILSWSNDETYLFYLAKHSDYKSLSVSVRSQIKRAVTLYTEFLNK